MKKSIPYILLALVLVLGMTASDYRENKQPVGKIMIGEMTWASGASAADTEDITICGKCTQIEVDVAENTTNNITFTVAVTTEDGGSLYSQATIPDNGATIYRAYNTGAANSDFEAFLMAEEVTVTVTPSGDPGATGATVNVGFYVE
jgi:hypothetical protein